MGANEQMGQFLRRKRGEVSPADVGMPAAGHRRVPGLRREEVALLAGVSPTYYTRLEQGLPVNASVSVLAAIARALGMDPAEIEHLFNLSGVRPRPRDLEPAGERPEEARAGTVQLLHSMTGVPALLLARNTDILAWNRAGHALVASHLAFDALDAPEARPNLTRMLFLDPSARRLYASWEGEADRAVASLQLMAGRFPHDESIELLVAELCALSIDFDSRWQEQPVTLCQAGVKDLEHPMLGAIRVSFEMLSLADSSGQRILTYTASAGSRDESMLAALMASH